MKSILLTSLPIVTLVEAKEYFRIFDDDEDNTIKLSIDTAIEIAEQVTNRTLSLSTFSLTKNDFNSIVLKKNPFVSITKIEYTNDLGDVVPYLDFEYETDDYFDICTLRFNSTPLDYISGAEVKIEYEAGYSPTPAPIKSFVLAHAATMFENREMLVVGTIVSSTPKQFYFSLLNSYRIIPV